MQLTALVVGDWSDDGHGKTTHVVIEHNRDLLAAYNAGSLKLGITRMRANWSSGRYEPEDYVTNDVMHYVADEYDDNGIPDDIAQALIANGIAPNTYDEVEDRWLKNMDTYEPSWEGDGSYIVSGQDGFVNLWLEIAHLGDPELVAREFKLNELNIGGYGLFS